MTADTNYTIGIVGGGPIGTIAAAVTQATRKNERICVLDKREEPTRHHGIRFNSDSIEKIVSVLESALKQEDPLVDREATGELLAILRGWKGRVIRTSAIESTMTIFAKKHGVTVLKGKKYEVTQDSFDPLFCDKGDESKLTDEQKLLKQNFRNLKVIMAADGSHSIVRKKVVGSTLLHEKIIQYFGEVKYETTSETPRRSLFDASVRSSKFEEIGFETLGSATRESTFKPGTLHFVVNEQEFEALRKKDHDGRIIRGDFEHPWNLQTLGEAAKTDAIIQKVFVKARSYLSNVRERGGTYRNEKITCFPMKIYQSPYSAKVHEGKVVAFVGDAESGRIFERGFNGGLEILAHCIIANNNYLKRTESRAEAVTELPTEFVGYQEEARKLFQSEALSATLKGKAITVAQKSSESVITPLFQTARAALINISYFFSNLFSSNSNH